MEAVWPDVRGTAFQALLVTDRGPLVLAEGRFAQNPFIGFRWLKAPGEVYGRGPVAKALPDIRTANKVLIPWDCRNIITSRIARCSAQAARMVASFF